MKKKSMYSVILCTLCLAFLLSACGMPGFLKDLKIGKKGADIDSDNTTTVTSTVNMMELEGVYSEQMAHRGTLRLTAQDSQSASIVIDWPGSATENAHWEMTGTYDAQKQAIIYNDAVMMEQTTNESGATSNRLVSSSGTGRFTVSGKNLVWTDDLAYIGSDPTTFAYSSALGADNSSSLVMAPSVSTTNPDGSISVPVQNVAPSAAPSAAVAATPAPSAAVATPTPTPAATPAPTPVAGPGSPVITKDPTDEKVQVGGSCWFVANHRGAILARWHFVAPDGTDLQYDEAAAKFPNLKIHNGEYDSMKLSNIPAELNGYRFYCRFSNNNGTVDSKSALLTVEGAGVTAAANAADAGGANANAANLPKVTKDPTDETVKPGEAAWFVAKHTGAILARWHFVSPDGNDYEYTDEAVKTEFPQMKIVNGDQGTMQLQNIPMNANGWKVYCRYSNNSGTADTKMATINVQGAQAATTPTTTAAANTAAASSTETAVSGWTDTTDLNTAVTVSGVSFSAPVTEALPAGTSFFTYRAKAGMIEADYTGDNSLTIRKSSTTRGNDLTGDYTNYSKSWTQNIKGLTVDCLGDGTYANAVTYGSDGGYFSISYNMGKEGAGLSADQINSLVNGMQ